MPLSGVKFPALSQADLTAQKDVCPKKWKTEAFELCYGFLHVPYDS